MFKTLSGSAFAAIQHHIGHRDKFVNRRKAVRNLIAIAGVFDCSKQGIFCVRPLNDLAIRICADILKVVIDPVLNISCRSGHNI